MGTKHTQKFILPAIAGLRLSPQPKPSNKLLFKQLLSLCFFGADPQQQPQVNYCWEMQQPWGPRVPQSPRLCTMAGPRKPNFQTRRPDRSMGLQRANEV
eukprot:2979868-Amphidinium_carterae.2